MKDIELVGRTKDGERVSIKKDATHYRAYGVDGKMIGAPYMELGVLLTRLGVNLTEKDPTTTQEPAITGVKDAPPADVTECGQHAAGDCKMDDEKCDGACGEHAARATNKNRPGFVDVEGQVDGSMDDKKKDKTEISRKRAK